MRSLAEIIEFLANVGCLVKWPNLDNYRIFLRNTALEGEKSLGCARKPCRGDSLSVVMLNHHYVNTVTACHLSRVSARASRVQDTRQQYVTFNANKRSQLIPILSLRLSMVDKP